MKAWATDARANRFFRWTLIVAALIILGDQASKLWIVHGLDLPNLRSTTPDGGVMTGRIDLSPIFDLTFVKNRGVSFGLLAGGMVSRVVLSILAIVVSLYVIHWAGRLTRPVAAIGAGFIIGGALGNAVDRIAYGYVVDFLDFSGMGFPWVFNVADVAINLGVACLAYDAFFVVPKMTPKPGPSEEAGTVRTSMTAEQKPDAVPPTNQNLTDSKEG